MPIGSQEGWMEKGWKKTVVTRETMQGLYVIESERTLTLENEDGDTIIGSYEKGDEGRYTIKVKCCTGLYEEMIDRIFEGITNAIDAVYAEHSAELEPPLTPDHLELKKKLDMLTDGIGLPSEQAGRHGIRYIGQLVQKTEREVYMIRMVGKGAMKRIKDALQIHNLTLGMKLPFDWQPPTAT